MNYDDAPQPVLDDALAGLTDALLMREPAPAGAAAADYRPTVESLRDFYADGPSTAFTARLNSAIDAAWAERAVPPARPAPSPQETAMPPASVRPLAPLPKAAPPATPPLRTNRRKTTRLPRWVLPAGIAAALVLTLISTLLVSTEENVTGIAGTAAQNSIIAPQLFLGVGLIVSLIAVIVGVWLIRRR